MSGDNNQTVIYDNFSGGDYGRYSGQKPPPNTFSGENVLVYADGNIGPRGGLKDTTPDNMPVGKLLALAGTPVVNNSGFFVIGDQAYTFTLYVPAYGVNPFSDPFDAPLTKPTQPLIDIQFAYVTVPGDKTYQMNLGNSGIAQLSGSPGGSIIARLGTRLLVSTGDDSPQFTFSAAGDFNSWPAENFINVGDGWEITAMIPQRNWLTIFKRIGIYIMTGVPGVNSNIRLLANTRGPHLPFQAAVDEDDVVYYLPLLRDIPAKFTGGQNVQLGWLKFMNDATTDESVPFPVRRSVTTVIGDMTPTTTCIVQGDGTEASNNLILVNHNGYWTKHRTSIPITGIATSDVGQSLILTDGGSDSAAANIYSTRFELNRPSFTNDDFTRPGDDSDTPVTASFTLPEWWAPEGREVVVRQVSVEFTKWNTGATGTNHFEVSVHKLGGFNEPGSIASGGSPQIFDEAQSSAGTLHDQAGTRDRFDANFAFNRGAGFVVSIAAMRGVAIASIQVQLELSGSTQIPRF